MAVVTRVVTSLGRTFQEKGIFVRLVCVGMKIFMTAALVGVFLLLFGEDASNVFRLLTLPTSFAQFVFRP